MNGLGVAQKKVLSQLNSEWMSTAEIQINLPTTMDNVREALVGLEGRGLVESVTGANGRKRWKLKK